MKAAASSGMMRFGFACIPLGLPQPVVRTCRLANATPARLRELTTANLAALDGCLDYVAGLSLDLFRINSGVIPFASHPVNRLDWKREFAAELAEIGRKARRLGIRLSMHPGQYVVLNSTSPATAAAAVAELQYHADFLDALGTSEESKIVVHLGGVYGDKEAALRRLDAAWKGLPSAVRGRLVLENDERLFSAFDALDAAERLRAPMVFDRFHHRVHGDPLRTPIPDLLRRAAATWSRRDGRPKVHFSSQAAGEKPGTHGETIDPDEFRGFMQESVGFGLDVMIEARGKESAALAARDLARELGRAR